MGVVNIHFMNVTEFSKDQNFEF